MRHALGQSLRCGLIALGCALLVLRGAPAQAVVISTGPDGPNLVAPANDPGWLNVGHVSDASGVYLGNRWVLTASHVAPANFTLSDGRTIPMAPGTGVSLSNPSGMAGSPDLGLYRLAEDPGLPSVSIADVSPGNQMLTMIGAGRNVVDQLVGWRVASTASGLNWNLAPLGQSNIFGYNMAGLGGTMRWGTNVVASAAGQVANSGTVVFTTRFDRGGTPFEGQATPGDSGGGVFAQYDGQWKLAGIMLALGPLDNQPANTVVYGEQTYIADLATYRDQILATINKADSAWQNQVNKYDITRSGGVDPRDLLALITELQRNGTHTLTGTPGDTGLLYDVNGDGGVSPTDLLQLVTALQNGSANPQASPLAIGTLVPEPSSVAILVSGGLAALFFAAVARRRRAG